MKQVPFFAAGDDLLPVLKMVEENGPVAYIKIGQYSDADRCEHYASHDEIPRIGEASSDATASCESFLILRGPARAVARPITKRDGTQVACVDQLANPDSITITPGGTKGPMVVIAGRIATVSDSAHSRELMKRFEAALRKHFRKIKSFRVGPVSERLLDEGARLTIAVGSPSTLDLTR